ncbi:aldose 1-epimerase [Alicyclobacillus curvatus]|nr:aldose 1-epimerase [Alicyclobacillus curvatus]
MTILVWRQEGPGFTQWILENQHWRLTVAPDLGGMAVSLIHRPSGEELLRRPFNRQAWENEPYLYGIPVLFPPGRITGGTFQWRGMRYEWPRNDTRGPNHLHGFVWNKPWKVTDIRGRLAVSSSAEVEDALKQYLGAATQLTITYELDDQTVLIKTTVRNPGPRAIPLALGFHTTWDLSKHDWLVTIPDGHAWKRTPDGGAQLVEEPERLMRLRTSAERCTKVVDDVCYRINDGVDTEILMEHPSRPLKFRWCSDASFRHLVIYRPTENSPFICVEPWTWASNAPNLAFRPDVTGVSGLASGEFRQFCYSISVVTENGHYE